MSSAALDAPPYLFGQQGDAPSPYVHTIPTKGAVQATASTATFDGTGAGGPFLACLSFFAQSGELLSRVFPQTVVQAGDVAQVSYAPFPGGVASNQIGGGLQYAGPNPIYGPVNTGDSLDVETAGADGMTWKVSTPGNNGWNVTVNDVTGGGIFETNHTNNPTRILNTDSGDIILHQSGTGNLSATADGGTGNIGSSGDLTVQSSGGNTLLAAPNGQVDILAAFPIILAALGGTTEAVIQARIFTHGNYFSVLDNTPLEAMRVTPQATIMFVLNDKTGAAIFEVHDDGSLHGKTGQTLTFDL